VPNFVHTGASLRNRGTAGVRMTIHWAPPREHRDARLCENHAAWPVWVHTSLCCV